MRASRTSAGRTWLRSLAVVPGALLPLVPSFTCPACLVAYAGVLSAVGLGFVFTERVLAPLIVAFLVIGLASVTWSTRSYRRAGPLVVTVLGAAAVVAGRLVWTLPPLLYAGVALLLGASIWNLWLRRARREPLVQLAPGPEPTGPLAEARWVVPGMHCDSCASRIDAALSTLPGVRAVEAQLDGKRVSVRYEPTLVRPEQLADALARHGFGAEAAGPARGT